MRLFILGEAAKLGPYLSTRTRDSGALVPFIKSTVPVQQPGSIVELMVGPSAPADAEDVAPLLRPCHDQPETIVRRSPLPYRAL